MMDAIGGYFELELRHGVHYHKDAICLNSARNCFEYILSARKYRKVYIPYYTCEVMLQPLQKLHVDYEFYHIGENLEPLEIRQLKNGEAYLYTNYFGLKQSCVEKLASIYKTRLIVDNAQAIYATRINGIDTFYSPRKFFGVSDGGFLYTDCLLKKDFPLDKSYDRMKHLLIRIDENAEVGYSIFRQADDSLDNQPIRLMSKLTKRILENVDYIAACKKRRDNFLFLHEKLGGKNILHIDWDEDSVPMVYPFYSNNPELRQHLIERKIFIARYWPNVLEWCNPCDEEYLLCQHVLPIPVDQRYDIVDMEQIVRLIGQI